MQHIKQLLIQQINQYDQRAAECCALIVTATLDNKAKSNRRKEARLASCIAGREALRHFGEVSGLLEKNCINNEVVHRPGAGTGARYKG